jgi:hypothetical protein
MDAGCTKDPMADQAVGPDWPVGVGVDVDVEVDTARH